MPISRKALHIAFLLFAILTATAQKINAKKGLALEGYDLVAYFKGTAVKGSEVHATQYNDVSYQFSSAANLKAFMKAPKAYLPQYGGYCAYAVAKTGDLVNVNPKTFEIRDGKLYLFYNAWANNTLKKWLKAPKTLKEQADANWQH